jgi:hypothetical protein
MSIKVKYYDEKLPLSLSLSFGSGEIKYNLQIR